MTPSQYIKAQGLPSTKYVADKVGKPAQTIVNWYHANFALFEAVVAGVRSMHYAYALREELKDHDGPVVVFKEKIE